MHVITGKTKILGVIGAPIAHSLSPIIQNAALHEAGLDYVYTAFPVHREALASAVCG
ncbi:MAG: shikimate dehydrogenase, partial [Selenomonas sp.]|nr:shikimate dehydrogenase [Selenomonas sp.]